MNIRIRSGDEASLYRSYRQIHTRRLHTLRRWTHNRSISSHRYRISRESLYIQNYSYTGNQNPAVTKLFGSIQDSGKQVQRGNVLFSDIFLDSTQWGNHLFNHVVIDNFSGGSINGGLFTEQAIYAENFNPEDKKDYKINFSISVNSYAFDGDENVLKALTETFDDLCNGMLPVGGNTNKGHGLLQGEWEPKK